MNWPEHRVAVLHYYINLGKIHGIKFANRIPKGRTKTSENIRIVLLEQRYHLCLIGGMTAKVNWFTRKQTPPIKIFLAPHTTHFLDQWAAKRPQILEGLSPPLNLRNFENLGD